MITFSKLGEKGRLGNQLFQIAFLYSLANRYGVDWCIPEWRYAEYFEETFPIKKVTPAGVLKEGPYKYQPGLFGEHYKLLEQHVVDIEGYFQHKEYWQKPDEIKELFKFRKSFVNEVKAAHEEFLKKPFIAVGVRRGDYVGNPNYYSPPVGWYLNAIEDVVTPGQNIIFFSDDLAWCRFHFKSIPNSYFPDFSSDIECMAFGTLADSWIIANSTFHWWSAFLSNAKQVIQPTRHLDGDLLRKEGDENFFNKEWSFSPDEKVDLSDVTFTIPVKYDHADRKHNLDLIICLLQKSFDTTIVVMEQGGDHFKYVEQFKVQYKKFEGDVFHRTKMLNIMAAEADTDILANWDADVMVPPAQIHESVKRLRKIRLNSEPSVWGAEADVVYPYDNLFQRIPRPLRNKIYPSYDIATFRTLPVTKQDTKSVGGALFYDRETFLKAGGENERFVSYGPEDKERFERFTKLGLRIERIPGNLYHFNHFCGPDSSTANPHYKAGVAEYDRIKALSTAELRAEVQGWWENRVN